MTNQQTLQQAKAAAFQMSRFAQSVVEVRQVSATGFAYGERGQITTGVLVGAFKNGQAVA